jgi:phosphoethanolamine N-methyltransferase
VSQTGQYSLEGIRRYEWIFGPDFLSSGAREMAERAAKKLRLDPGARLLDIGSGLGGPAFYFAQACGAFVTGVDSLDTVVKEAIRRAREQCVPNVEFIHGDILGLPLDAASFDAIYSKDAFLHIPDKPALFAKIHALLKPGGALCFMDYLRGTPRGSPEFEEYVAASEYSLVTFDTYARHIGESGLTEAIGEDLTPRLLEILREDLALIGAGKDADSTPPSSTDADYLTKRWRLKIRCCEAGDMKWGLFTARRPR